MLTLSPYTRAWCYFISEGSQINIQPASRKKRVLCSDPKRRSVLLSTTCLVSIQAHLRCHVMLDHDDPA